MGKGSTGAAAGGGAIYGLGIFGVVLLLAAGRRVLGVHLGALPEGNPLAGVHGLRRVQGARRVTAIAPTRRPANRWSVLSGIGRIGLSGPPLQLLEHLRPALPVEEQGD